MVKNVIDKELLTVEDRVKNLENRVSHLDNRVEIIESNKAIFDELVISHSELTKKLDQNNIDNQLILNRLDEQDKKSEDAEERQFKNIEKVIDKALGIHSRNSDSKDKLTNGIVTVIGGGGLVTIIMLLVELLQKL